MNKKAIWVIIGLMSAALIGIIVLQTYWIRWSIQLNENRFNKDVIAVLNRVSDKLQNAENIKDNLEVFNQPVGGGNTTEWKQEVYKESKGILADYSHDTNIAYDSLLSKQSSLFAHLDDINECHCPDCERERFERYEQQVKFWERMQINKLLNPEPITHRIELDMLNEAITNELANRFIDINFNYGVYSHKEKSFVIVDGHYVVRDNSPQPFTSGTKSLYNSEYRVDLYPDDIQSPGLLMIYFPGKTNLVWGSVWKTLLGSIIFTGLILFSFAYTIQVIFFQKKVGEMKSDFINNMTHEFKTPIATISLAADSITSPMVSGNIDKVRRFADIIKQENRRMNQQVEKVLQMAVIDKDDFHLKRISINLHEVISRAVENAALQIEKKDGVVSTELNAAKPVIQGDQTHVTNIIHNLLDNANKYSPTKPEISVHTRNINNGVEVTVKDKGIGMTKEARKHIFDKFYRVHTGNLHDVKGFGLGLSYVKAMVNAHNGHIEVKSEPGKGSSFILFFPFMSSNN
jgi:two-component system, OmpR family, phosphate regulon sensor histidine kinase PhoR